MQLERSQSTRSDSKWCSAWLADDFAPDRKFVLRLVTTVLIVVSSACRLGRFDSDSVAAGDYGVTQAGRGGTSMSSPPPSAGSRAGIAGTSPSPTTAGASGVTVAGASGGPAVAGASGVAGSADAGGDPMSGSSGGSSVAGTGDTPPANPCDLSGRWLSTVHTVTDALGQQQIAHSYVYYEIAQQGDAFTVRKGMDCGDDAVGAGAFAATVDFRHAWLAVARKAGYTGRTGTSTAAAGGCQIEFAKWYTVRGATVPHYTDPSIPMPTVDDPAMGDTPGWEDWDADGNPGITGLVSGAVTGKIFTAPRVWTHIAGTVADIESTFKLSVQWDQESNVMSYDGSPLLLSEAARAADATLHFAEFARLAPDHAVGDDDAICTSLVALAPALTPVAAGM